MEYTIINSKNFDEVRRKIKDAKKNNPSQKIILLSDDDEFSRKILEHEIFNILAFKLSNRKDKQKQRDSGFNHIMAKITKKNNIVIGIILDEIIEATPKEKSKILDRIKQNIKLCNKNKLKMKFVYLNEKNKRNLYDLKSLGLILGMPTWMTKEL